MPERRLAILAEGYSHDPHYGKTARGIIRYGRDPVVCLIDSRRPGEEEQGIPVVGSVEDALGYEPTTAIVGVATSGGRFPPNGAICCAAASPRDSTSKTAFTSSSRRIRSSRSWRGSTTSSSATCAARRPG